MNLFGMNLTNIKFFIFLLILVFLYYVIGKYQKYLLAAASIAFYFFISPDNNSYRIKLIFLVIYITCITYVGGILIERAKGKGKNAIAAVSILGLFGVLFLTKYAYNLISIASRLLHLSRDFSWLYFASVIGISYFILAAIGYLMEVAWELHGAEKNIFSMILFIFYFPQIISGPVTRYPMMIEQFNAVHKVDCNLISLGIRRMLWGYFKKLVISERFAVIVTAVYSNYGSYSGIGIIAATLCYAVLLYTDFSGYMDIVLGTSQLFGITLPENFKAPFLSESVREFWQRWHITLGTWFKDYVMYPVQKTKFMITIGKKSKKTLGKKAGKKIPFYLSMVVLWILIGIWHGGTGYYFIASAGIPFILLFLSDLLEPVFIKLTSVLHINTQCSSWHWFRRIRTLLLICLCWIFVCSAGTTRSVMVIKHMFESFVAYTPITTAFETFGLNVRDAIIMVIGVIILLLADIAELKESSIIQVMDKQNALIRAAVIYLEIFCILTYGMIGSSAFIYFQF